AVHHRQVRAGGLPRAPALQLRGRGGFADPDRGVGVLQRIDPVPRRSGNAGVRLPIRQGDPAEGARATGARGMNATDRCGDRNEPESGAGEASERDGAGCWPAMRATKTSKRDRVQRHARQGIQQFLADIAEITESARHKKKGGTMAALFFNHEASAQPSRCATAVRSSRSSLSVASMRAREKSLISSPCTISYLPFLQVTG